MTKAKLRKLLTKPKFRAWLEAKKPRTVVGVSRDCQLCPLANYIGSLLDGPDKWLAVRRGAIRISESGVRTPPWCGLFIKGTDYLGVHKITASRALRILDAIK